MASVWAHTKSLVSYMNLYSDIDIIVVNMHTLYGHICKCMFMLYWVRSLSPLCVFQVPLVAVDSFFYGKLVIAPLNILLYNVFTPHGPDLYGNKQAHIMLYHIDKRTV